MPELGESIGWSGQFTRGDVSCLGELDHRVDEVRLRMKDQLTERKAKERREQGDRCGVQRKRYRGDPFAGVANPILKSLRVENLAGENPQSQGDERPQQKESARDVCCLYDIAGNSI